MSGGKSVATIPIYVWRMGTTKTNDNMVLSTVCIYFCGNYPWEPKWNQTALSSQHLSTKNWRSGWDSNPGASYPATAFPVLLLRPTRTPLQSEIYITTAAAYWSTTGTDFPDSQVSISSLPSKCSTIALQFSTQSPAFAYSSPSIILRAGSCI